MHSTQSRMWMLTRILCLFSQFWENISTHSHTSISLHLVSNLCWLKLSSTVTLSVTHHALSGVTVLSGHAQFSINVLPRSKRRSLASPPCIGPYSVILIASQCHPQNNSWQNNKDCAVITESGIRNGPPTKVPPIILNLTEIVDK